MIGRSGSRISSCVLAIHAWNEASMVAMVPDAARVVPSLIVAPRGRAARRRSSRARAVHSAHDCYIVHFTNL